MESSRSLELLTAKRILAIKIEVISEDSYIDESSEKLDHDSLHPNYKSRISCRTSPKFDKGKSKVPAAIEEFLKNNPSNFIALEKVGFTSTLSSDEGIDDQEPPTGKKKNKAKNIANILCSSSCVIG